VNDSGGVAGSPMGDRKLAAVGWTVGLLVLAFLVFIQAGHDQALGPLDVETAQLLALAIWVTAPLVGGLALRHSSTRTAIGVGAIVCLVVGLAVAVFPTSGFGGYTCSISLPPGPISYPLGRLAVGAFAGLGMAIALAVTSLASRRLLTAVPGIILGAIVNYYASAAAYLLFYDGVRCL